MANTPISGTAGRVIVDGGNFWGIKSWRLDQTTAEVGVPHFESDVDALGRVWPEYLFGLSGATGTLEAQMDINAANASDSIVTTGVQYTLLLLFSKTSNWGFAVLANFTSFGSGTNVENQPATFTAQFRVTGVVPLSAVVP